jgi:hypothetical protein
MKHLAWTGLLLTAGLSGCLPNNFVVPTGDKTEAKPVEPVRHSIRPPVTAGQINGANAQEKAQALRDELDRDLERALESTEAKK